MEATLQYLSSFALYQKKVWFILGQLLAKILLLFREYLILMIFYFASQIKVKCLQVDNIKKWTEREKTPQLSSGKSTGKKSGKHRIYISPFSR